MLDALYIAMAIAFFGLSAAYTNGCERLRGGKHD
jgi:hypothetical protein